MGSTLTESSGLKAGVSRLGSALFALVVSAIAAAGLAACQIEWPLAEPVPESTPQPVAAAPAATSVPLPIVTPVALPPPPTSIPTYTPVPTPTPPAPPTATPAPSPTTGPTTQPTSTPSVTATPTLEQLLEFLPTATPAPQPTTQLTFVATPVPVPISTATPIPTPDLPPPTRDLEAALVWLDHLVPWFLDPPAAEYEEGAGYLLDMWFLDPYLAIEMAHMYWLPTGLEEEEVEALSLVAHIGSIDIEEARKLSGYPWITDGITGADIRQIGRFLGPVLVQDLAWVKDGLKIFDAQAMEYLMRYAAEDPQFVRWLTEQHWIMDGITHSDVLTLEDLRPLLVNDPDLAKTVLGYPWATGNSNHGTRSIFASLGSLSRMDKELARAVAANPVIAQAESVHSWIIEPPFFLDHIARHDLDLAWQLTERFSDYTRLCHVEMTIAAGTLAKDHPRFFHQLRQQPWFQDGIDDEEAAFLSTVRDIVRKSPSDLEQMLKVRYARSGTVDLPISGQVNIWAFQKTPFPPGEDIVADIARALRADEESTGLPLAFNDVIVHVVVVEPDSEFNAADPYYDPWPTPARVDGHIRIARNGDGPYTRDALLELLARYRKRS